ncbi:MAG: metallophosphoesterase family protein [Pyrobaculum sp.]
MAEPLIDLLIKTREKTPGLVVEIEGVYTAVGDLHGDLKTLELILKEWPPPYLFLGDYVDRGEMGLEVVMQVFQLFIEGKAVALRGNHESPLMNIEGGFLDELCNKVSRCGAVYKEFTKTFAALPLAAVVNKRVVALHGGIPLREDMRPASIEEIKKIEGDLTGPENPLAFQILWNDPCHCEEYLPSPRGPGTWLFGKKLTDMFHKTHNTEKVVRGHTYIPFGCATHHKDSIVTIFSSTAGPYRKTKPKIATIREKIEIIDIATKTPTRCPEETPL